MLKENGRYVVAKFGGSSLSSAERFQQMAKIVKSDQSRQCVVVSAPGKRTSNDYGITDLLYLCQANLEQNFPFSSVIEAIYEHYKEIVKGLNIKFDLEVHFQNIQRESKRGVWGKDYLVSRGEYLSGLIAAALLDFEFVDAAKIIFFDDYGRLEQDKTRHAIQDCLCQCERGVVVPGFYGSYPDPRIKVFPRNGSDITGALVAEAIGAAVYEKWTDVSGILAADSKIVSNPQQIETLTYEELRELAYSGADVFQQEAMFPVRRAGIPINIRNTHEPDQPGTMVVKSYDKDPRHTITGIAGRKGFSAIILSKMMMNSTRGFGRRVLSVLEANEINYEHTPTGIDIMSVVVADEELNGKIGRVLEEIKIECNPDSLAVRFGIALIAVVGQGIARTLLDRGQAPGGVQASIFSALRREGIKVLMVDQGLDAMNIIIGVENNDFEAAIRAIYKNFF